MRKPVFTICEEQSADLISTFVVRCLDSIILLVSKSEISIPYLASVAAQAGLCLAWSQTPKTGFLETWLNYYDCFLYLLMPLKGYDLSPVTRKPVFGVFVQGRLKPACASTEASRGLKCRI